LGKLGIRLSDGAGFVKLAPDPTSAAALRREARVYAAPPPPPPYRRPVPIAFHDGGDWAVLWLEMEAAAPFGRWRALRPRPGPYEAQGRGKRTLSALAPAQMSPRFAAWRGRLLDRHGDEEIAVAPAHGDFVYWNLLDGPVLLDFEHFEECAPLHQDRLSWTIVPFGRRVMALGFGEVAAAAGPTLAQALLPDRRSAVCELALFLLRHADRLERETRLVAAQGIDDTAAQLQRDRLLALYPLLLAGLLR
jgi:hypothetical protein